MRNRPKTSNLREVQLTKGPEGNAAREVGVDALCPSASNASEVLVIRGR